MSKLGYWQECRFMKASTVRSEKVYGKVVPVRYMQLDISARSDRDGRALNKRFLVARILNKRLQAFCDKLPPGCEIRARLYASGYHTEAESNKIATPIDVFEIIAFI